MELLQRLPLPRRLAARVWLISLPSALVSFERRRRIPRIPVGRGRLLGLLLIAGGAAVVLFGRSPSGADAEGERRGLVRLRRRPAVGGGLLALGGVALLLRSLLLAAYAVALAFAFTRDALELEDPPVPRRGSGEEPWAYDETQV